MCCVFINNKKELIYLIRKWKNIFEFIFEILKEFKF